MKLIERSEYINEIKDVLQTPDIKVITGVRRSGKSKLLETIADYINDTDPQANLIHINYNLTDFEDLTEYHALEIYAEKYYQKEMNNYLLIDEVQMCPSFEKAINSLHAKEKFDIWVTGSNAFLQSSDLATLFVGRTYEIHIFPFSFREYLAYYPTENLYASLTKYITDGGMAGSYLYKNEEQKNALIVRDIEKKYKIRNKPLLYKLIDFLMDNIGNVTSIRTITDTLSSSKAKADHKTIGKYIDLSDQSFKYARLGTKNMDYGHALENIIAIELLRRGYEVYVGTLYDKEIDFVAMKQGLKTYIQVAYDISEHKTFEREVTPLLAIKDAYPKILIARTYQPPYQHEGIRVVDAAEWLNEED